MANIKFTEFPSATVVGSMDIIPIVQDGANKKTTASVFSTYIGTLFVNLSGTQTITGSKTFSSQLISSVATGTAPFSVASTTKVTNLNADLLDGLSSAAFQSVLTNPITGTGTTNYLPKFIGASALGNSSIQDSGSLISIGVSTLINTGTANQNTKIYGDKVAMSRTSDAAEVVYFSKTLDLGATGTANINGYNGIQFRTQGAESVKLTIAESGAATFSSSVTATQFTADSRTRVGGGYIADMGGAGNDTGIFFGANTILPSNGSGTITTKDLGSATYPWGAATFSADATINGVKVGRGAGNVAGNTAVGASSLNANTTGAANVAVGSSTLTANTTGNGNASFGSGLASNTTGSENTAIGSGYSVGSPLQSNTTGSFNTALGSTSLKFNTTGSNNTGIGWGALLSNTASNNTAVGFEAGYSNTSGTGNATNGFQSLRSNTTGSANTSNGFQALYSNIVGSSNTAIGASALALNTASNNTAVGFEAGYSNTSGVITAIGYRALKANTTGGANNALGDSALLLNTTGSYNIGLGTDALSDNTTGSVNIGIGLAVKSNNYSNNIIIGTFAEATASNQFVIGSSGYPAGAVATEVNVSSKVWNVIINGVAQKILLA
jgi:hypothetical protein